MKNSFTHTIIAGGGTHLDMAFVSGKNASQIAANLVSNPVGFDVVVTDALLAEQLVQSHVFL
jgi:hypothetical protein